MGPAIDLNSKDDPTSYDYPRTKDTDLPSSHQWYKAHDVPNDSTPQPISLARQRARLSRSQHLCSQHLCSR